MRVLVREEPQYDLCNVDVFQRAIHDNPELAVVVGKTGCPTCRAVDRIFTRLEGKIEPPVVEIELQGDEDPCNRVADLLRVTRTPTVVYFRRGAEAGRFVGEGGSVGELERQVRALLPVSG